MSISLVRSLSPVTSLEGGGLVCPTELEEFVDNFESEVQRHTRLAELAGSTATGHFDSELDLRLEDFVRNDDNPIDRRAEMGGLIFYHWRRAHRPLLLYEDPVTDTEVQKRELYELPVAGTSFTQRQLMTYRRVVFLDEPHKAPYRVTMSSWNKIRT